MLKDGGRQRQQQHQQQQQQQQQQQMLIAIANTVVEAFFAAQHRIGSKPDGKIFHGTTSRRYSSSSSTTGQEKRMLIEAGSIDFIDWEQVRYTQILAPRLPNFLLPPCIKQALSRCCSSWSFSWYFGISHCLTEILRSFKPSMGIPNGDYISVQSGS